jgi:hypothetical protein
VFSRLRYRIHKSGFDYFLITVLEPQSLAPDAIKLPLAKRLSFSVNNYMQERFLETRQVVKSTRGSRMIIHALMSRREK